VGRGSVSAMLEERCATPLAESLGRLETLVSPYTGLVRFTYEVLAAPDDARLVRVGSESTDHAALLGAPLDHIRDGSGGSGVCRDAAVAAAVAETAERYSLTCVPHRDLVFASADELPDAVDPERFALFHERQFVPGFAFERFARTTRVDWVRGIRLPDLEPAFLPAQLVYMWDRARVRGPIIGYGTSNGGACGATFAEALLNALLELVERDAVMITWYGRLSLPVLDVAADSGLRAHAARYFDATGVRYAGVDLSQLLDVPTVLGVVRGDTVGLGVGAASAPTVQVAWKKALAEAFAVRSWARVQRLEQAGREFRDDFTDVRAFADHIALYADPARAIQTAFLDGAAERRPVADIAHLEGESPAAHVRAIVRRLADAGLTAYAVDVTAPDVRAAGLTVVKAVVPELCPLDVDHRARYLGGTRLYEAAWRRGLRDGPLEYDDVNPLPHPFP